jgi:prepilin-type N-terminal cleavage/methylation domain-containing protein
MKLKKIGGFTLVELLLGLTIGAIIGVSVYNMFWSAMKLDEKWRYVHENYMEVLLAGQALTHDLENAVSLDLSASYPNAVIFDGQESEFSFLTQTPMGIKRVHYYSGLPGQKLVKRMIGRVVNPSSRQSYTNESSPVEFLLRQENSLADWLNETGDDTSAQIMAAGFKKGSFNCRYAPFAKNLHMLGSQAITFTNTWDEKGLPMEVSCGFVLYDPRKPQAGLVFQKDIFLAPVVSYYHEQ